MDQPQYYGEYGAGGFEHTSQQVDAGGKKPSYTCIIYDCPQKPFARSADLDRHYKQVHTLDTKKEQFFCDYPKCPRSGDPFYRKDHCRDHLREYHREDMSKRGVVSESWLEDRIIKPRWWRCSRCLIRVEVAVNNWDCPGCKMQCEHDRIKRRTEAASRARAGLPERLAE